MKKTGILLLLLAIALTGLTQINLLVNGGFDEVNTCTEYKAECGVEGWFYLKDVKIQLLAQDGENPLTGTNSLAVFYNWINYTGFTPVIGSILPCRLQKGKQYTLKGLVNARLNPKLNFKIGICLGERFYVPRRPFSATLRPDSIESVTPVPNTNFVEFSYHFTATGDEKYLTFGSLIHKDSLAGKTPLTGVQTVSVILDRFTLQPDDPDETLCDAYALNKNIIYDYNFRHREMDYSLYGRGELAIEPEFNDSSRTWKIPAEKILPVKTDTLKLGDVLFDFNKALLKPAALTILSNWFTNEEMNRLDSIRIEGHTDSVGTDIRNITLSTQRSESVKSWLQQHGLSPEIPVSVIPYGRSRPVASNRTAEGRAQNRRVELILFRKTKLPLQ